MDDYQLQLSNLKRQIEQAKNELQSTRWQFERIIEQDTALKKDKATMLWQIEEWNKKIYEQNLEIENIWNQLVKRRQDLESAKLQEQKEIKELNNEKEWLNLMIWELTMTLHTLRQEKIKFDGLEWQIYNIRQNTWTEGDKLKAIKQEYEELEQKVWEIKKQNKLSEDKKRELFKKEKELEIRIILMSEISEELKQQFWITLQKKMVRLKDK